MKPSVKLLSSIVLLMAGFANTASAISITQTRSVTVYEPVGAVWEVQDTDLLRDRIRLAKNTGFNAVWLILEWDKLDPAPSASGEVALADCGIPTNQNFYQCAIERAFAVIGQEGVDVFLSLNYAGGDAPQSFTNSVQGDVLVYGDGPAKLYRHARYVARLVARNGIGYQARFLFHDEGILGPYASLWNRPEAQQRFRDYLYGINPDLRYWNSRWGRTGSAVFQTWAEVKTFAFESQSSLDLQLHDHVAWVNWTLQRTLAGGAFEQAIRQIIPSAIVGMHATYFSMINPNTPVTHRAQSPLGGYSTFDFASVPYYDGPSPYGLTFEGYVSTAKAFFAGRPLLFGELGSQVCESAGDCGVTAGKFWTSYRVDRRQASFFTQAVTYLGAEGVGFNVWNLSEFDFPNREGSFGIYAATPAQRQAADQPRFKRAGCALRTAFGSTAPSLCLIDGAINADYTPRAIWLTGRGFNSNIKVRLSNAAGTFYASQLVQPIVGSAVNLSFQLADQVFTELGCGPGISGCTIGVEVLETGTTGTSNRVVVPVN